MSSKGMAIYISISIWNVNSNATYMKSFLLQQDSNIIKNYFYEVPKFSSGASQAGNFCLTSKIPRFYQLISPFSKCDKFLDTGAISKVRSLLSVFF